MVTLFKELFYICWLPSRISNRNFVIYILKKLCLFVPSVSLSNLIRVEPPIIKHLSVSKHLNSSKDGLLANIIQLVIVP